MLRNTQVRWIGLLAAVALTLAVVGAACGGGSEPASGEGDTAVAEEADGANGDAAAHQEEGSEDVAAHEDEHAVGEDDAAAHSDTEANAHLEVAPKDELFLVEMSSFAFTPNTLEVNAGDVVEIAIQNVDPLLHDFTIDEIDADVHVSYLGGTGEHVHEGSEVEGDVHFALTEAGSGVVHLQVHEPGEYRFYCTVPGHAQAGMQGTLIVHPQNADAAADESAADESTGGSTDDAAGNDDGHEHAPGEEHD